MKTSKQHERALHRFRQARTALVLDAPFFGHLSLKLKPLPDDGCKFDMWTDGVHIGFRPEFVLDAPFDHVKGVLAHEVVHCVAAHMSRREGREERQWNVACDHAINPILVDAGFALPDDALIDPQFRGMSAEAIYSRIYQPPANDSNPSADSSDGDQSPGSGTDDSDPDADSNDQAPQPPPDGSPNSDDQSDESGENAAPNGSQPQDGGESDQSSGCSGEVRDLPDEAGNAASEAEREQAAAEWEVAAVQAANMAKSQGSLPGSLESFLDEMLQPNTDWRELLRRFMTARSRNEYSVLPPNRRFVHNGLYLPSRYNQQLGEIVVAIDTSGSVSQAEVDQFIAEITAICEETRPVRVHVIGCDTRVVSHQEFEPDDFPLDIAIKGRGGTDFRPPFAHVEQQGIEPECLIYMTDMGCNSYPQEPTYPVLWAASDTPYLDHCQPPPFGEMIRIAIT